MFIIEQSKENLTAHAGLAFIGQLLDKTDLSNRLNRTALGKSGQPDISNTDVVRSYLGLLCQAKTDFDHIEVYRGDDVFKKLLGIGTVPSSPTTRQRLELAPDSWNDLFQEEAIGLLKQVKPTLTPCWNQHVAVDVDVSPFDNSNSHKQGVSRTYKGFDGYAPILAYLGGPEGFCLGSELREGKTHCQRGTPEFLRLILRRAKQITTRPLLVRLDSGNDAQDNVTVCQDEDVDFVIKRNLRREDPESYLTIAKANKDVKVTEPRIGKVVYRGRVDHSSPDQSLYLVYEVIVRYSEPDGQMLLLPSIEVNTYWTSIDDDPDVIIQLYNEHGTMEQFHAEFKTDMKVERLPSGKFPVNSLILSMAMLAFNMLRVIGQESLKIQDNPLPATVFRRRLDTVIKNLITMPCRLVYHARQWKLRFGIYAPFFQTFKRLYNGFARL